VPHPKLDLKSLLPVLLSGLESAASHATSDLLLNRMLCVLPSGSMETAAIFPECFQLGRTRVLAHERQPVSTTLEHVVVVVVVVVLLLLLLSRLRLRQSQRN
jgi:hypothetical protein